MPAGLNAALVMWVLGTGKRSTLTASFAAFCGTLAAWQLSDGLIRLSGDAATASFWRSFLSFGALLIGPAGLHFALLFTGRAHLARRPSVLTLIYGPAMAISTFTQAGFNDVRMVPDPVWGWTTGLPEPLLNTLYGIWIGLVALLILGILTTFAVRTPANDPRRVQALLVAGGFAIPTVQGIITQVVMPAFFGVVAYPIASTVMTTFSVAAAIAVRRFDFLRLPTPEERLSEAQTRLEHERRTLAEAERIAHLGSWEYEYQTQHVTWSREMFNIYGVDPATFHPDPTSISNHMIPEDRNRFRDLMKESARTGKPFALEHRIRREDGATRWIFANAEVHRDRHGRPLRASGTSQDITPRIQSQETVRRSEAMLVEAQRIAHVGNWVWDIPTNTVEWSDEMFRIYGYEARAFAVTFERAMERVVPEDRARISGNVAGDVQRGHAGDLPPNEYRIILPDGRTRVLRGQGRLEVDSFGRPTRFIGTVQDVTELKQAEDARRLAQDRLSEIERLRQVDQFKTQLLNTASHELNTPLTPIKLQVHMLRTEGFGALNEEQRRALDVVARNMDRMEGLVRNMLDVGRIQSGRIHLKRADVDLNRLLGDTVEAFAVSAQHANVALSATVQGSLPVNADAPRITQVLFNLFSNAIKFTPEGGRINTWTEQVDGRAVLRVQDTGLGLTPSQAARLFQPFTQVHDGTQTAKRPGTGLGLYISREIVQLHGGDLRVASEGQGRGATFTMELPVSASSAAAASAQPSLVQTLARTAA